MPAWLKGALTGGLFTLFMIGFFMFSSLVISTIGLPLGAVVLVLVMAAVGGFIFYVEEKEKQKDKKR